MLPELTDTAARRSWHRTARSVQTPPKTLPGIPAFLRIAATAAHLRELGMTDRAIALALDVSDKTVAKAIDATRRDFG